MKDIKNKSNFFLFYFVFKHRLIIKNHISSEPSEDLTDNINTLTNKDSPIISLLNNENNTFLDEILLHIFEGEIIHYFDSIPKITDKDIKLKYSKYFKV